MRFMRYIKRLVEDDLVEKIRDSGGREKIV
jgi:DNA-binding MarR family transcriptional regulator